MSFNAHDLQTNRTSIALYLQRSTTNKETIHIGLSCQLLAVGSSHRTCGRESIYLVMCDDDTAAITTQLLKKCIPP
jgi:hypothetical protein